MFNLKVVLRETGIKADTLRAWERRYGLPSPERTSGGHRLFTQHEIEMVKWLHARQDEGLRISRAVELWRTFKAEGKDPLDELAYPTYGSATTLPAGEGIEELRSAWVDGCKSFDEGRTEDILKHAFAHYPPEVVCLDLLAAALAEIGEGWYTGEITVQQEHFASELATRRVEYLISSSPPPTIPGGVLVLCPPGEEHTFSPLMITFLLRKDRREAIFLGANVPVEQMDEVIQATDGLSGVKKAEAENPDLILMDVMMPVVDGLEAARRIRENPKTSDIPIVMLSAKSQEYEQEAGLESGADRYICKPFTPKDLIAGVSELLREQGRG